MSKHSEQIQLPKWQKRRLEILEAANFKCEECGSDSKQLHVHHSCYGIGRDVWDYPNELLICLCNECHLERQKIEESLKRVMMARLRRIPLEKLKAVFFELFDEAFQKGMAA